MGEVPSKLSGIGVRLILYCAGMDVNGGGEIAEHVEIGREIRIRSR
jgi:hypothetical protein